MAIVLLFFFITFLVVRSPTTLKFVPPVKYNNFFIGRWNREETCEIRKFDKAIWESNFDTMGYVSMGRWKYRKQNFSVSTEDIASHISIIQNRLTIAETIDGTRIYHCFWPNGQAKLELYTLSADEIFAVKNLHASKGLFVDIDCLKTGHYVAAVYEGQWYQNLILEINWDKRDLLVKSMHNSGYDKNCLFWPPRNDIYHVPFTNIIGLTEVPDIVGRHGWNSYKISAKLFEIFNQNLSKLLNRKQ